MSKDQNEEEKQKNNKNRKTEKARCALSTKLLYLHTSIIASYPNNPN